MGRGSAHVQEAQTQAEWRRKVRGHMCTYKVNYPSVLKLYPLKGSTKQFLSAHAPTAPCLLFWYPPPHPPHPTRANSVTWNPHKMMGVPLQCSAILVRERVSVFLLKPGRHAGLGARRSPPFLLGSRDYCRAATPCAPATSSSRTSSTMWPTTLATRPSSVGDTSTSSSSGSCGKQRCDII